jgi:hypothetical protein
VVKGLHDGRRRGWLRVADGSFASDFTGETISDAALRAQATAAGEERTYTCVPPGSGFRIGLDHDDDGVPDATERDEDTDPDDPHSTPAIVGPWPTVPARSLRLADATGPPRSPAPAGSFKSATSKLDVLADRIIRRRQERGRSDRRGRRARSTTPPAGDDDVRVGLPASGWKIRGQRAQLSLPQRRSRRSRLERDREARRDLGARWRAGSRLPERAVAARDRGAPHARRRDALVRRAAPSRPKRPRRPLQR